MNMRFFCLAPNAGSPIEHALPVDEFLRVCTAVQKHHKFLPAGSAMLSFKPGSWWLASSHEPGRVIGVSPKKDGDAAFFILGGETIELQNEAGNRLRLALSGNGTVLQALAPGETHTTEVASDDPLKERLMRWLRDGEVGLSSSAICYTTMCDRYPDLRSLMKPPRAGDYPRDSCDFRRRELFLAAVPEAREQLHRMSAVSQQWASLVPAWDEIRELCAQEAGGGAREPDPAKWTGRAPQAYARMKEVLGEGRAAKPAP